MFDWPICAYSPFSCCCSNPSNRTHSIPALEVNDTNDGLFKLNHENSALKHVTKPKQRYIDLLNDPPSQLGGKIENLKRNTIPAVVEAHTPEEHTMLVGLDELKANLMDHENDKSVIDTLGEFRKETEFTRNVKRLDKFNEVVQESAEWHVLTNGLDAGNPVDDINALVTSIHNDLKFFDFFEQESTGLRERLTGVVKAMIAKHEANGPSSDIKNEVQEFA